MDATQYDPRPHTERTHERTTVAVRHSGTADLMIRFEGPATAGMLARYAGVLTLSGLDIVWAAIAPLPPSRVRHEFQVARSASADPTALSRDLERLVRQAEDGELDVAASLRAARDPQPVTSAPAIVVEIDLDSQITTGVRVKAPDRPGLLHDIALTVSNFGYRTRSITVLTSGAVARDTFRIVDVLGDAPKDVIQLESLRTRLITACR